MSSIDVGNMPELDIKHCQEIEEEFGRFITFVEAAAEPIKKKFQKIAYPVFTNFYLFLLGRHQTRRAENYANWFSSPFLRKEGHQERVNDLLKLKTVEEFINHHYFKNFHLKKWKLNLSTRNTEILIQSLKSYRCIVLSLVLQVQFGIPVISPENLERLIRLHGGSPLPVDLSPSSQTGESTSQRIENPGTSSSPRLTDGSNNYHEITMHHCVIDCGEFQITCADINEENNMFACCLNNCSIHIQKLETGLFGSRLCSGIGERLSKRRRTNSNAIDCYSSPEQPQCLIGHSGYISRLAYAPFDLLMSCSRDSTARAWRMTDFKTASIYKGHKNSVFYITTSRNDTFFATGGDDRTARLWNYTRKTSYRIYNHSAIVDVVAFDPAAKYLATASTNKSVQLWTIQDGRPFWTLPYHDAYINCIEFSPNGKHMACGDDNGCIKIWDLPAQKLYKEIKANTEPISHISYNNGGSILASCSSEGRIKHWDARKPLKDRINDSLGEYHPRGFEPFYIKFGKKNKFMSIGQNRIDKDETCTNGSP